ncbi:cryptochrome/photolyase family protein [uncultured Rhodoblastus sp.]|uniref:cryptochrome/photolyase family protein n=1 Tax=uncultured Rhodoblastus sp. TaxID=543037 RepID=UPI0025D63948|nr:cryptochrome/photolyase family protein [uncultured Rhodoblastus sp.]
MTNLRIVLGDQLSDNLSALTGIDERSDVVLMMEVEEESAWVRHHKQKIVLALSAMRHFADTLRRRGVNVDYIKLDAKLNTGGFTGEVQRAVARHRPDRIIVTEPSEWRVQKMAEGWASLTGTQVEVRADTRFFASRARFAAWAKGRRGWRLEHFYREMRREHGILMEDGQPAGGQWNYDAANRKRLPARTIPPARLRFPPDATTREVMALVERRFPDHFGALEAFGWPVTRADALRALEDFIAHGLPEFGDYQDAMKAGAPFLFHSLLAPALNLGLLSPAEICRAAETAWKSNAAPLNAVEGFVRQVLGWREYVRGVYWTLMPEYAERNALAATRKLPEFYWTGDTDMRCLRETILGTARYAYAHHIQRLMVTGNFALLAGLAPSEVERWYLAVYADAYEWVEMPNTLGMAIFADGGQMASKPYAASGAYIDRMADYCRGCAYDVKQKTGPRACPFNFLYWAFLIRQKDRLSGNPRLAMPYRTLGLWPKEREAAIVAEADAFLDRLDQKAQSSGVPA